MTASTRDMSDDLRLKFGHFREKEGEWSKKK